MVTVNLGRRLTRSSSWPVTSESATAIAGAEAERRGIPWDPPIRAYKSYGNWAVRSRANCRGGNVQIRVDGSTGQVLEVLGPTPR